MTGPKTARIAPLTMRPEGVEKLFRGLNPAKKPQALITSPIGFSWNCLTSSPAITTSFTRTLDTDCAQRLYWWSHFPVFKKGIVHLAGNYWPASLTYSMSKFLEHIICKQILDHFETHSILTPLYNMVSIASILVKPCCSWCSTIWHGPIIENIR